MLESSRGRVERKFDRRCAASRAAGLLAVCLVAAPACGGPSGDESSEQRQVAGAPARGVEDGQRLMRERMVDEQIRARGIRDDRVLEALRRVPRHAFVPEALRDHAYADRPLPIGHRQTISQPFIVAAMTAAVEPEPTDRVLEIGTGSGYQAAILAELVDHVYTIEIVEPLGEEAREKLADRDNVTVRIGDGFRGWPEEAPFDAIVVTAAPEEIPPPLIEQLAVGGRLVIPVGDAWQELRLLTRNEDGIVSEVLMPVRFVPMTGEAEGRD